jgi:hypothetical protein
MLSLQPYYDSSSSAKVIISLDTTKCYATFFMSFVLFIEQMEHNTLPVHFTSSADAKVARALYETGDTCMENLPLHRLRAYFPHKPRPFQAHALFHASAEGMNDGRNSTS